MYRSITKTMVTLLTKEQLSEIVEPLFRELHTLRGQVETLQNKVSPETDWITQDAALVIMGNCKSSLKKLVNDGTKFQYGTIRTSMIKQTAYYYKPDIIRLMAGKHYESIYKQSTK